MFRTFYCRAVNFAKAKEEKARFQRALQLESEQQQQQQQAGA